MRLPSEDRGSDETAYVFKNRWEEGAEMIWDAPENTFGKYCSFFTRYKIQKGTKSHETTHKRP